MRIEVRAHRSIDGIMREFIREMEKDVPEDVRADLAEMGRIRARIEGRFHRTQAISQQDVRRYNALCYKHFGKVQDGGEFVKEEAEAPKEPPETATECMSGIPYSERRRVYEKAIEHYGIKPQIQMVIEEMSELTKELCKYFRGADNIEAIADEVADVTIMLEQLRLILGINDEVNEHMDAKVQRLAGRLGIEVHDGKCSEMQ